MIKALYNWPFFRFALAGVAGLVVDTAVLYAALTFANPFISRLISFPCAVFTTWVINRQFAFAGRRSDLPLIREFGRYFLAMLAGGAVNYLTYSALILWVPLVRDIPFLGVCAGTLAGMIINFVLARTMVFSKVDETV